MTYPEIKSKLDALNASLEGFVTKQIQLSNEWCWDEKDQDHPWRSMVGEDGNVFINYSDWWKWYRNTPQCEEERFNYRSDEDVAFTSGLIAEGVKYLHTNFITTNVAYDDITCYADVVGDTTTITVVFESESQANECLARLKEITNHPKGELVDFLWEDED